MKLFYLPGSCALGPHIALEYPVVLPMRPRASRGAGRLIPTYLAINPLGLVPALVTATAGTITEVPAILSYIADVARATGCCRQLERQNDMRLCVGWRFFRPVHPAFGRLWRAERFCDDADCKSSVEHVAATQLTNDFAYIEKHLANQQWVAGDHLTAADFHPFVFGRLGLRLATSTRDFPSFHRHMLEIANLAVTKSAMAQQGIDLEGPPSGPG